jgi:hypothetical protein
MAKYRVVHPCRPDKALQLTLQSEHVTITAAFAAMLRGSCAQAHQVNALELVVFDEAGKWSQSEPR